MSQRGAMCHCSDELESVLEVAHLASGGAMIELRHLPPELEAASLFGPEPSLGRIEREARVRALAEAGGNVSRAARAPGVARSTLHRMKRRHQVH